MRPSLTLASYDGDDPRRHSHWGGIELNAYDQTEFDQTLDLSLTSPMGYGRATQVPHGLWACDLKAVLDGVSVSVAKTKKHRPSRCQRVEHTYQLEPLNEDHSGLVTYRLSYTPARCATGYVRSCPIAVSSRKKSKKCRTESLGYGELSRGAARAQRRSELQY